MITSKNYEGKLMQSIPSNHIQCADIAAFDHFSLKFLVVLRPCLPYYVACLATLLY